MTQEQLASQVDRTVFAISQLERGLSLPSFETLERLSAALRVPVRDFFDESDSVDAEGMSSHRMELTTILSDEIRALSDDEVETIIRVVRAISFNPARDKKAGC